jgi:predicted DCC family thiol-disulfide oxidoreductase YuxK
MMFLFWEIISVISEITNITDNLGCPFAGWVLYDARCGMCVWTMRRNAAFLRRLGYRYRPLQDIEFQQSNLGDSRELLVLTPDNRLVGGADALIHILSGLPFARGIVQILRHPRIIPHLRRAYRWVADHRYRISQVCLLKPGGAP